MEPLNSTDVIAIASLIGGIFGRGGGNELNSALTMQAFVDVWPRGRSQGLARVPLQERPRSADHDRQELPVRERAPSSRGPRCPTRQRHRDRDRPVRRRRAAGDLGKLGRQGRAALEAAGHASNWELVSAKHSTNGHPIAVLGPQVGYYVPQILMEEDLHGAGHRRPRRRLRRGQPFVELGHGRDYAWSATTATSDNVDTFAEVLCKDTVHYIYRGKCVPMEKLEKAESWSPNAIDSTAPAPRRWSPTGPCTGSSSRRGKVHGKKVAFVHQRSTYFTRPIR